MNNSLHKKISVCIATYNRRKKLIDILLLLENQSMAISDYEIIITDSFSDDGTDVEVYNLQKKYNNIIYKRDCKNILANKRNEGIKLSNSNIILFMDDDVYPYDRNFIHNHYIANINNEKYFFCGQIRFDKNLVKEYNYYRFRDEQHLKNNSIGIDLPFNKIVVMNLSFKKEFINHVGYLDERFINYGCEDTEFGYRIVNSGFKLRYLENALAIHREDSKDIVEYSNKIAKNAIYGKKVLKEINEQVLNDLEHNRFDKKNIINTFFFNDFFGSFVKKYLIIFDKINLFYNYYLYKYFLYYINYKHI